PSTPSGIMPAFLTNLTTSSASDFTCRVEVPLATKRISAMEVLPRTSISCTSLAFNSSSAASTCRRRISTGSDFADTDLTGFTVLAFFGEDLVAADFFGANFIDFDLAELDLGGAAVEVVRGLRAVLDAVAKRRCPLWNTGNQYRPIFAANHCRA